MLLKILDQTVGDKIQVLISLAYRHIMSPKYFLLNFVAVFSLITYAYVEVCKYFFSLQEKRRPMFCLSYNLDFFIATYFILLLWTWLIYCWNCVIRVENVCSRYLSLHWLFFSFIHALWRASYGDFIAVQNTFWVHYFFIAIR